MTISAIVAIDEKNGMGKNGGIPWHIPGEQARFKQITTPHPMIMGRKTFASIGRILPNRPHIIVTRDPSYQVEGVTVAHTVEEAIEKAKEIEQQRVDSVILNDSEGSQSINRDSSAMPQNDTFEIFIIGGGEIFKESMQHLTRIYLTKIDNNFDCDTFFPDYSEFTKVVEKEEKTDWEYPYEYVTLEKAS